MTQIFADLSEMKDGLLSIGGSEYNHIRNVLRMHPGEELSVRGTDGGEDVYRFEILSFSDGRVLCRLRSAERAESELPVRVLLFQGLPKADKMDFIVQKAVEMGVTGIVPVEMRRSVVKLQGDRRKKRVERWQSIAGAAAKQSRRAFIPEVQDILSMEEALHYAAASADSVFLPYELLAGEKREEHRTREKIEALREGQTIAFFVGPEGGFDDQEADAALKSGALAVSLGRRILRTETASLAFLAFLAYRFEL